MTSRPGLPYYRPVIFGFTAERIALAHDIYTSPITQELFPLLFTETSRVVILIERISRARLLRLLCIITAYNWPRDIKISALIIAAFAASGVLHSPADTNIQEGQIGGRGREPRRLIRSVRI